MKTNPAHRPFQAAMLLALLKMTEKYYRVAVVYRDEVHGGEGHVYHKVTGSKFFQMSFEASFDTKDLLVRREAVIQEMATEATTDFVAGLKAAGGKYTDVLMILAYPAQPPVVLGEPTLDGTTNVWCKLIVSLPERLPKGLPEGFMFKA